MGVINVLHLTGHLAPGGAEKMAVLTYNELGRRPKVKVYFCYIRDIFLELMDDLENKENVFSVKREGRFDIQAISRLRKKIRDLSIDIVHAHTTTVFIALAASFGTKAKVVWHDHLGETDTHLHLRNRRFYKAVFKRLSGYIGVNEKLTNWAESFGEKTVIKYIPNFSKNLHQDKELNIQLKGNKHNRIVKLAHFRRQKNHLNLINALEIVRNSGHEFYVYMAGGLYDAGYVDEIKALIESKKLGENIFIAGLIKNTGALLKSCSIGVLSSDSEGLPLALIEYGLNGLVPISTDVGQCKEVLGNGTFGALVPANDPVQLAEAISRFLSTTPEKLDAEGERYEAFISEKYGEKGTLDPICEMYETIYSSTKPAMSNG